MEILNKEDFLKRKKEFLQKIKDGAIFVYPTDTVYGLGCDAMNDDAVRRLRKIKNAEHPLSVIAPSKKWISGHCIPSFAQKPLMEKLPGPYTFILKLKKKTGISPLVNNESETLGVRIPGHWFSAIVSELGLPLVTTSANISGKPYMTSVSDIDPALKKSVDFIIEDGEMHAHPSTLINPDGKRVVR